MQSQRSSHQNEKQEGWEDRTAGRTEPSWFADAATPRFERLTRDISADVLGVEFAPIKFEVAKDLAHWSAEIPGKVVAKAEALTGPITPPGKRVQLHNAPGSETGPGTVATWGRALANEVHAMGFKFDWKGRTSKHIPFNWAVP